MEEENKLTVQMMKSCSGQQNISDLQTLEIAFTKINELNSLQECFNLRELNLIETGALEDLSGLG